MIQNSAMVMAQFAASAVQKPQWFRSIHGKIRNIGSVGSTNQKVPSAWLASRSEDCPAWCIHSMATKDVSGSAMSSAERRSLKSWTLLTTTMMSALRKIFPRSTVVNERILSQGMRFIGKEACDGRESTDSFPTCKSRVSSVS